MRIRSPLLIRGLSRAGIAAVRMLCRTCRVKTVGWRGTSLYDGPKDEPFLYSAWHDGIVLSLLARRPARNTAALVSQHRDGDWVTEILNAVGVKPVRGSTNRGGVKALREMLAVTKENNVCITSDGPRGPRRTVSPGIVFLAAKSGCRIVPAAYACTRRWSLKGSWTDMQIPKPFTTIYIVGGEPIAIPRKVDRDDIEHYTSVLQRAMDENTELAEAYARGEPPAERPTEQVVIDGYRERPHRAAA